MQVPVKSSSVVMRDDEVMTSYKDIFGTRMTIGGLAEGYGCGEHLEIQMVNFGVCHIHLSEMHI